MSESIFCTDCSSITIYPKYGFGTDSATLHELHDEILKQLEQTETLGSRGEILRSLDDIFVECSEQGWDGYDATPITEEAYLEARRFILSLPITSFMPMPEIIPEPSGEIALEWSKGSHQIFIASVNGKNEMTYAGLFGSNKTHGQEYFGDSLPTIMLENLKRLYL
jgi:hypothetical protein